MIAYIITLIRTERRLRAALDLKAEENRGLVDWISRHPFRWKCY